MMLDALLSVDPGTHSAWVLWERVNERSWTPRRVGTAEAPTVIAALSIMGGLRRSWDGCHVLVEGQFYVDHRVAARRRQAYQASPWKDVARLVELRCWWQAAAIILGATTSSVDPGRWIPAMTKGLPRDGSSKDRIKTACHLRLPGVPLVKDENDAALMGYWWLEEQGQRVDLELAEVA